MYREWCAIIRREGLTVNQTAERFGVSYRTITAPSTGFCTGTGSSTAKWKNLIRRVAP